MITPMRVAVAAVILALAAGCGGAGGQSVVQPPPPSGAGVLAVRLAKVGGFLGPAGTARRPPDFSLYGDGRLISAPPDDGTQAWPDLAEHRVEPDTVRRLYQEAVRTAAPVSSPDAQVPDGPSLTITLGGAAPRITSFSALTDRAVRLLADFSAAARSGGIAPYQPAAIAAIAFVSTATGPDRPWPLADLPGQPLRGSIADASCTLLRGADVGRARQATAGATPSTVWRSAGRHWSVVFRPLLPDEPGCTAL